MNVDKNTQICKSKKHKRTIPAEPASELSDSLHEMQASSSQFVTPGKKPIVFHVITSTAQLTLFLLLNQIRIM